MSVTVLCSIHTLWLQARTPVCREQCAGLFLSLLWLPFVLPAEFYSCTLVVLLQEQHTSRENADDKADTDHGYSESYKRNIHEGIQVEHARVSRHRGQSSLTTIYILHLKTVYLRALFCKSLFSYCHQFLCSSPCLLRVRSRIQSDECDKDTTSDNETDCGSVSRVYKEKKCTPSE